METYILVNGLPVLEPDFSTWAIWMGEHDRTLMFNRLEGYEVSTVYLGIARSDRGKPLLWETMVLGSEVPVELENYQQRYASLEEATIGHISILKKVIEIVR